MQIDAMTDGTCVRVPLNILTPAPWGNVRKSARNSKKREDLKQSISSKGVLQAITVRPNNTGEALEVLAGNGRWELSQELGLLDIPVVVKHCSDKEGIAIGLAENLEREDLTLRDEIEMAQACVSYADGDYEEASKVLGWDIRKVRGRLKLNQCSDSVLSALGSGTIKIGHAEVLCQFTEKLQNGTLEKVLAEKWTVDYLKERANGAARVLRFAKFSTSECEKCPHNSTIQSSLFDNHIGEGKCLHLPCYRTKTEEWLAAHKSALESEEGVVLLAIEKPPVDRRTVSKETVGDAFESDCLTCVSRVRVLQDGINRDCGEVTDNQCVNLSCFAEKSEAVAPKKNEATDSKKKPKKKVSTAPEISAGVKQQGENFVRTVLGDALLETSQYPLALTLFSLARATGYSIDGLATQGSADEIAALVGWEAPRLEGEIQKAIRYGTLDHKQGGSFDGVRMALRSRHHVGDRRDRVIARWNPSKEWFDTYQKGGIESFCRRDEVGFAHAWDQANGEGAFAKLMKKKKSEIIAAIIAEKFDWTSVAPKEVLELVS
ncbi:MAG: ParB/RepB/Spo0J family partition protein [Pseudomonadales bacterium]|nr:ParB/RepB/Spo0J family partition protein [Pseudomonadales bacterium]